MNRSGLKVSGSDHSEAESAVEFKESRPRNAAASETVDIAAITYGRDA